MNAFKTTALAALASTALTGAASANLINEFQPNPAGTESGTDSFDVELLGTPGTAFAGFLSSIESDVTSGSGEIDRSTAVSGTYDSNGLAVVSILDLENPSFTFVFSSLDGGGVGTDYDTDNDGTLDIPAAAFGTIFDALGINDTATAGEPLYGAQLGGIDLAYSGDEPQLVFRDAVNTATIFAINDPAGTDAFDQDGNTVAFSSFNVDPSVPTFGSVNPTAIPEPASLALVALGGAALLGRRRSA